MPPPDDRRIGDVLDDEERLARIEWTLWGLRGENGMVGDLKALRKDLADWRRDERVRREAETTDRLSAKNALILGLLSAVISLIAVLASLLAVAH